MARSRWGRCLLLGLLLGCGSRSLLALDGADLTTTDSREHAAQLLERGRRGMPLPECVQYTLPAVVHRHDTPDSASGWLLSGNPYHLNLTSLRQEDQHLVVTTFICHLERGPSAYIEGSITQGRWILGTDGQRELATDLAWLQLCQVTETPPAVPSAFHDPVIHAMELDAGLGTALRGYFCGVPSCPGGLEALKPTSAFFAISNAVAVDLDMGAILPPVPGETYRWALRRVLASIPVDHPLPPWTRLQLWLMAGRSRDLELAPLLLKQMRPNQPPAAGPRQVAEEEDRVCHAAASALAGITGRDYRFTKDGKDRPLALVEADYRFLLQRNQAGRMHAP